MNKRFKLYEGDNIQSLKKMPDNSIDSVVTDPPYGLSFMGKKWDYDVPSVEFWKEVYRVLKPGGHVLSFGGTRTYHRMVVNIEDAGFEIRDQIMWIYGSGFPKSHNIGKAVDKKEGNEREVVGIDEDFIKRNPNNTGINRLVTDENGNNKDNRKKQALKNDNAGIITKGNSQYEGWGTALKPANEPICVARKPLSEANVAANVIKWGTGGINIDGCRVGDEGSVRKTEITNISNSDSEIFKGANVKCKMTPIEGEGRFPANIIFECICDEVIKGEKGEVKKTNIERKYEVGDGKFGFTKDKNVEGIDNYNDTGDIHTNPDCPCYQLDQQSGVSKSTKGKIRQAKEGYKSWSGRSMAGPDNEYSDKGGASRFFYQAKASRSERNMGLDGFEDKTVVFRGEKNGTGDTSKGMERFTSVKKNNHPTVKPVALMAYLCRLVTPENGIILDPFMGSGSTGIASQLEGFRFVGCEMEPDYIKIASKRIEEWEKYKKFIK